MFVDFNILNQLGSPSINSNTFANRPAAGQTGRLFVSTDTFELYRDNGTGWDLIGGPGTSTITGSGTATQVAYFTGTNAIGSSANLFWDNTNSFLGVGSATPSARIETVKTDGIGIYANYTTNAGSGSSATAIWAKNITNSSGFAAVIEENTPNTASGQYPLLIKHSLSAGTAAVGMGTGLHFQLPDNAGTFKTTQLTIETINAAAATYASRYRFNVQSNGTSTPVAYINATGLGIFTATPGVALDIHSTGTIAQLNSTGATSNGYLAFQRAGTTTFSIGDTYNAADNYFRIFGNTLSADIVQIFAATGKTTFTSTQTISTGLARANYFEYNMSTAAGATFSTPNAISAVGASLIWTLNGSATIPTGARSGLDAYNQVNFAAASTLTVTQGTKIRAYSNLTAGWNFYGAGGGTITHLAGMRVLFPDQSGGALTVTNNYGLLINDQTPNTGAITYTNRWGIYQEGASDLNYLAANLLIGSTTNSGEALQVTGTAKVTSTLTANSLVKSGGTSSQILAADGSVITAGTNITISGGQISSTGGGGIGGSGTTSYLPKFTAATTLGDSLIYDNATNIGISTATPGSKLQVNGNLAVGYSVSTVAPSNGLAVAGNVVFGGTASVIANYTSLTINGANGSFTEYQQAAGNTFRVGSDSSDGGFLYTQGNTAIRFGTNGSSERMRITNGGNVAIGTTTIGSKLQVNGNAAIGYSASTAAPTNGLAVSGNVGVGTTSPGTVAGYQTIQIQGSTTGALLEMWGNAARILQVNANINDVNIYGATNIPMIFYTNTIERLRINAAGGLTFADANNISFNTITGTIIATATTQKLSFWNKTPIVQPTTGIAGAARVAGGGAAVTDTDTFGGYTIAQVVAALRNVGLLA